MNNNNNQGINVLSNQSRNTLNDITKFDSVDIAANMIRNSGASRGERRRLEKALAKSKKLTAKAYMKAQDAVNYNAYEEYKEITDLDFVHFNAILGLVMYEDYHWTEKSEQEHGQITSLFERIQLKMRKYNEMGLSTKEICDKLDELTGIRLVPDNGYLQEEFLEGYDQN